MPFTVREILSLTSSSAAPYLVTDKMARGEPRMNTALVRQMWQLLEPIHASLYYAPEANAQAAALGYDMRTRWPSYFAWRSAPLGTAGPELVSSAYYSFSPAMVREHVPAIWDTAAPDDVLAARERAADATLRAL